MQLDRMTARIAPRSAWQAIDLGTRLYQQWRLSLTLVWLTFSLLPAALIMLLAGSDHFVAGLLLCFWLKPACDRPLLEFCARALFGEKPTLAALLRAWPRGVIGSLMPWLLLRRLSPARSFVMPIAQLENQTGALYFPRRQALLSGNSSQAFMLTLLLILMRFFLCFGLMALIVMLIPDQYYLNDLDSLITDPRTHETGFAICLYLANCIVEPLYVCCGFALYLNKRTWLEGWDLEVGLRQIGTQRQSMLSRLAPAVLLAIVFATIVPASPARAEQVTADNTQASAHEQAIDILAGPDFSPMKTERRWRFKKLFGDDDPSLDDDEDQNDDSIFLRFLKWLFGKQGSNGDKNASPDDLNWLSWLSLDNLAEVMRFALWVLFVSVLMWVLLNGRRWLGNWRPGKSRRLRATHIAGLDIRAESLPDDVCSHALAALQTGQVREALSLLYRGSLSKLLDNFPVDLGAGATEGECLQALRKVAADDPGVQLLATLTPLWVSTAWAHRPPSANRVEEMAHAWRHVFVGGGQS